MKTKNCSWRTLKVACLLSVSLASMAGGFAQDNFWITSGDGFWDAGGNWSEGVPP